jgi:hypothetical protein
MQRKIVLLSKASPPSLTILNSLSPRLRGYILLFFNRLRFQSIQ